MSFTFLPRLEINLSNIRENSKKLIEIYNEKGILVTGVTKAVSGDIHVAEAMIDGGVQCLADSRIENIKKMRSANINSKYMLLRPTFSQAEQIVEHCDISLNSEIKTLQRLSHFAKLRGINHDVIVMVELGDLREGVMPEDIVAFIYAVLLLPNLTLVGLGTNLACHGGVMPDANNMKKMNELVNEIEQECSITLPIVSGGNSANYNWFTSTGGVGRINQLRIGESILLGRIPTDRLAIKDLHLHAFHLFGEVIESKLKPSMPQGSLGENSFGETKQFNDRGLHKRVIVALGRQDVDIQGLSCEKGLNIIGASSDHLIMEDENNRYSVGDEVVFNLSYSAVVSSMSSLFIQKCYIYKNTNSLT